MANRFSFGPGKSIQDVGGCSAGGQADGDVSGHAESFDLPGEDMLECVVVGDRRHVGHIRTEGYCRQCSPLDVKFVDQFGGEVGGLGRGAAVAEDQNFVALADGPLDDLYRPVDQRMAVKAF